eukprot:ANDGO_08497.mRNA.1 hypothetical protein
MSTARQSILMRRKKAPSLKNEENYEREFENEQQSLEVKRAKLEQIASHRVKAFFGDEEDRKDLQEATRVDMEAQLRLREELRKQEALEQLRYSSQLQEQAVISQTVENDHERARKEYLRHVMEENKRLASEKEAALKRIREREIEAEKNAKGKMLEWGGHFR